jgi:hypothetical protein
MRPDTEFGSYDLKTGTWEFHVNHFSSYAVGSEGNRKLVVLVNEAYKYWIDQKPIPDAILRKIEAVELTADQFLAVFCHRDTPEVRAIELIDGRVRFRERDKGPHAGARAEMIGQVRLQDPQKIFYSTTNFGRVLSFSFTNNV